MDSQILYKSLLCLILIGLNGLQAQQAPRVNRIEHCCNGTADFSAGRQGDCLGGFPMVSIEDTIPMFSLSPAVDLSPIYFPSGGTASWSHGPNSLTVSVSPGTYEVTYTTNINCAHKDTVVVLAFNNGITGSIFADLNGDGVRDVSELAPALPLVISLYDLEGNRMAMDTTDPLGNYSFLGLMPKDYIVKIDSPLAGMVVSPPGPGNQFHPVSRATFPITINGGTLINNVNGGLFPQLPGRISGRVWFDENGNGIREAGEAPIPNIPIFAQSTLGGPPDIILCDPQGSYDFPFLPQGNYTIGGIPSVEFPIVTIPNQGPANTNSDFVYVPGTLVTPPSAQVPFPILINPPGQQVPNIDLGLKKDTVVRVKIIGILSGADRGNGDMGTELETGGYLPGSEPYSGLGYGLTEGAGLVLNLSKVADVVDYVVVELRDKNDSSVVIASKPGLILKDGTVVDECGETMTFAVPSGSYYVALRHKNHLDIRTKFPVFLDDQDFTVDFTDPNLPTAGIDPQKTLDDGRFGLWSGDANGDNELKYSGSNNDRQAILFDIGGTDITNSTNGYKLEDINLDGVIKYSGPNNDRQPLLENIGGIDITNTRKSGDN